MRGVKSHSNRRKLLLVGISLVSLILIFYNQWSSSRTRILKEGITELGRLCSTTSDDCYIVKDQILSDLSALRSLESKKNSFGGRFYITLIPLKVDSSGSLIVNRDTLRSQYIASMISFPYALKALKWNEPAHILSIGLGGASLDMFFHTRESKFNITVVELDETMVEVARKWFDAVEDDRRRVVVANGLDFLKRSALNDQKYDMIALDACNSQEEKYRCPAFAFYAEETMKNVYNSLNDRGSFMINVISTNISAITSTVKRHFPTCFLGVMASSNRVVGCTKREMSAEEKAVDLINVRFGVAMTRVGLDHVLGSVVFKEIN